MLARQTEKSRRGLERTATSRKETADRLAPQASYRNHDLHHYIFENPVNIDTDELTMLSIIIGGALISDPLHCL